MMLPPAGLYAITSDEIAESADRLVEAVGESLEGGAVMIQYRDKRNPLPVRAGHARRLQVLCRGYGVPLILNDGPLEWLVTDALDGIHLGAGDGEIGDARRRCPEAIIGATCGPSLERAEAAVKAGASYLAFGAFHASRSKPGAALAPLGVLSEARRRFALPLCAIGGLTPDNARPLVEQGADYIAAIGGVFGARDIRAAAKAYAQLFCQRS